MTSDEVTRIAGSLTKAQRDAVCGRFSYGNPMEAEDGEAKLFSLGIWGRDFRTHLTPLGILVRDHLKSKEAL